jgi:hypothetical protein
MTVPVVHYLVRRREIARERVRQSEPDGPVPTPAPAPAE